MVVCLCGCAHTSESILGYNERGQTVVRVCKSYGQLGMYGSDCTIELRDYGRVTNDAHTVNVISNPNR